jgi:hypothetical protein
MSALLESYRSRLAVQAALAVERRFGRQAGAGALHCHRGRLHRIHLRWHRLQIATIMAGILLLLGVARMGVTIGIG